MRETWVWSLGLEDPLEKEMATHSSIPAWRISWTEEPGRLESTGSQRVRHDWATSLLISLSGGAEVKASACNVGDLGSITGLGRSPGEGNGNPLQYSCLENPMNGGALWATVHGSQRVGHNRVISLSLHFHHSSFWRRQWQPTPVLLPGKSHRWRSLVGYSPWGRWESDMTGWLHFHFSLMNRRRKWQPTPVFLPRESQGRGSLVGCHLWGRTESDMIEVT